MVGSPVCSDALTLMASRSYAAPGPERVTPAGASFDSASASQRGRVNRAALSRSTIQQRDGRSRRGPSDNCTKCGYVRTYRSGLRCLGTNPGIEPLGMLALRWHHLVQRVVEMRFQRLGWATIHEQERFGPGEID